MNVTLFGNSVFADDQVKMKSLGGVLIQYAWCPYQKGKFGPRRRYTKKEDDVKTQENTTDMPRTPGADRAGRKEGGRASLAALGGTQSCQHLISAV